MAVSLNVHGSTMTWIYFICATICLTLTLNSANAEITEYFPPSWDEVCGSTINIIGTESEVHLKCSLGGNDGVAFKLADLHDYAVNATDNIRYSIEINCVANGNLSMRWPMKIDKLVGIKITNCSIYDYIKDWNNLELDGTKDSLEVLELINCVAFIDLVYFAMSMKNIQNMSRAWNCIHDQTLQKMVFRNYSNDFIFDSVDPETLAILDDSDGIFEILERLDSIDSSCKFKSLTEVEETYMMTTFKSSIRVMQLDTEYKNLRSMNFSHNGWTSIPIQLLSWYETFRSLKYMDLSYNRIEEVKLVDYSGPKKGDPTIIDVRYNNITVLPIKDLETWAKLSNTFVDIRGNPLHCDCLKQDFVSTIQSSEFFIGNMERYKYIQNMTCATPQSAKGLKIIDLTKVSMGCEIPPEDLTVYLVVMAVTAAILILVIIVTFRYRREIKIILYIRFHILLPWDVDDKKEHKPYDAFVSYCTPDEDWVYDCLQPKLESPSDGETYFKLCLHQRDFIGGKSILDNILDSIENSRHTILVLSRNFLKSMWGLQEFRYAYQESITKKCRHLIIVKYEDIPEAEMDSVLKRCLKSFTYLDIKDPMFFDRLKFALAIKSRKVRHNSSVSVDSQMSQCSVDSGYIADVNDIDLERDSPVEASKNVGESSECDMDYRDSSLERSQKPSDSRNCDVYMI